MSYSDNRPVILVSACLLGTCCNHGTFTRTLSSGSGVTAAALRAAGIEVVSDEALEPS